MKYRAMAGQVLNFATDDAKFMAQECYAETLMISGNRATEAHTVK